RPHAARATWPGGAGPGGGNWALLLLGMTDGGARISVRGEAVTVPPHHAPVPMGRSTHRPPVTSRIASSAGATADGAVGRRRGCDDRGGRDAEHAAQWADRGRRSTARWNPVYRALMDRAGPPPPHAPEIEGSGAAGADLVRRQLSTPALLVVAVTE